MRGAKHAALQGQCQDTDFHVYIPNIDEAKSSANAASQPKGGQGGLEFPGFRDISAGRA